MINTEMPLQICKRLNLEPVDDYEVYELFDFSYAKYDIYNSKEYPWLYFARENDEIWLFFKIPGLSPVFYFFEMKWFKRKNYKIEALVRIFINTETAKQMTTDEEGQY